MKQEWFTASEFMSAKLPNLPRSERSLDRFVQSIRISCPHKARQRAGQGGGFEYHYSALPQAAQQILYYLENDAKVVNDHVDAPDDLWARYERLTTEQKDASRRRLNAFIEVQNLCKAGVKLNVAIENVSKKTKFARSSFFEWRKELLGYQRSDWLAVLALGAQTKAPTSEECHPDAWTILKSDYLRPEKPSFAACYRRMMAVALQEKLSPIPSERSLRRKLDIEVPKAAQFVARERKDRSKHLYPAQQRTVCGMHAMEFVNMDGHELDLFVRAPWSDKPVRVILLGIQDVYSRKIVGWTLSEAETWEAVRACIGSMIENHDGMLPYNIHMDNGRAFAGKMISGGAKSRHRFKIKEDDVAGLLVTLGIEPHFVKPYSGQSKPIERAWRNLAEEISKHPSMSGCYTGNKPDAKPENYGTSAVALDQLKVHVAYCIDEHNERTGRTTETAHGQSFNQVFDASIAEPSTIIRYATMAQRSLWLLSAATVTARKPDGAVHLYENRYWHPELNNWIGKKLTMRFDPSDLHKSVKIYQPNGRLICDAECLGKTGFVDTGAARQHAKNTKTHKKNLDAVVRSNAALSPMQLGEIMAKGRKAAAEQRPETPMRPVVTRLITGSLAHAEDIEIVNDDEQQNNFAKALKRLEGGESAIIPFPQGGQQTGAKPARKSKAET